jgi:hypothetical protein
MGSPEQSGNLDFLNMMTNSAWPTHRQERRLKAGAGSLSVKRIPLGTHYYYLGERKWDPRRV